MAATLFCGPGGVKDPRLRLLKQASNTGLPARRHSRKSKSISVGPEVIDGQPVHPSLQAAWASRLPSSAEDSGGILPPPPPRLDDLLAEQLAVDVTTTYNSEEEDGDKCPKDSEGGVEWRESDISACSFTQKAFVAQGSYRVGWVVDYERRTCTGCTLAFTTFRRRHHCRACGEIFCARCCSSRASVPELVGERCPLAPFYKLVNFCPLSLTTQFTNPC